MTAEQHGFDIGVDTSSANNRTTVKQQERILAGRSKARTCETICRRNTTARRIAITGVQPTQCYGFTSVGMAPSSIIKAKSNIAKVPGLMAAGTCSTSVIRWSFRKGRFSSDSADPRVRMPIEQVKSWIGLWNRAGQPLRQRIEKAWHSSLAKLSQAKSRWQCV